MAEKKKIRGHWTDEVIGIFSPKARLTRMKYRFAGDLLRKYEGAGTGRRTKGWNTSGTNANTEIQTGLPNLRNRSRDLVRNNPYAAKGMGVIESSVVGRGIWTQFKAPTARTEKTINQRWRAWAMTTACDFDGRMTFAEIQSLAIRSTAEGGECLVLLRQVGRQSAVGPDGVLIEVPPIQLQLLEGDFLSQTKLNQQLENGNRIIQGIELDPQGKRVAYHLFQDHPGAFKISPASSFRTNRVLASDVTHVFRMDRAGQLRGVPWLSPVIIKLRDLDEYEDATLVRQKIAAMFTAFVHDLQGVPDDLNSQEKIELGEKMEPGLIEILPSGKTITLATPPTLENYKEFINVSLHSVATGLGIPFTELVGDFSEVNFSSSKMSQIDYQKNIDKWRQKILIPHLMQPVVSWFLTGAQLLGDRTDNIKTIFTPPKRELVNPDKEIPAMKAAVRSGFTTLSEVIRQSGRDPDTHFEEIASDNKKLDKLKLILDTDPRKVQK